MINKDFSTYFVPCTVFNMQVIQIMFFFFKLKAFINQQRKSCSYLNIADIKTLLDLIRTTSIQAVLTIYEDFLNTIYAQI